MSTLRALFDWFPGFRRRDRVEAGTPVSTNYVELDSSEADEEAARLRDSWKSPELPARQRELADQQLDAYRRGQPIDVYDAMVAAMRGLKDLPDGASVLEIGCSSGYYCEVFDIDGLRLRYTGCDYSEAFQRLAKERYPHIAFDVEDATKLSYPDNAFDVVISGCCLLHIPEYEKAVAETARVAKHYAIFHRTPVLLRQPNRYFRKLAYGVETVEIHFNEPQFLALLEQNGLTLEASYTLNEERDAKTGEPSGATRTYVLRKRDQ